MDQLLDNGIYVALVAMIVYFSLASEFFLTERNLFNIGQAVAITGILAAGLTIALIAGQLDLSIGAVIALSSVVAAIAIQDLGLALPLALVLAVGAGVFVGLVNASLVVGLGINSIIVTLAVSLCVRGVALILVDGQNKPITDKQLQSLINDRPFDVPLPFILMLLLYAVVYVFLTRTRVGWHIYATGGNESAAARAGVKVKKLYVGLFVTTGALAAVGGVLATGRSGSGGPTFGVGAEFDVLTAVLLGGIGLAGGSGQIQRTLAGVFVIGVLNNGLTLLDVDAYYQQLARGAVFVVAVVLGATSERRRRR